MVFLYECFLKILTNIISHIFMQIIKAKLPSILYLDGKLLAGSIPVQKEKLVLAWIEIHKDDLLADWELAVDGKTPFRIKGLDQ
jgi:hypothetical protein